MIEINPYREFVASISATDFEKYCLEVLKAYAEAEELKDFSILHNQKVQTSDGEYQIDIMAEFMALSVSFKVIIECKRYTRPVEREKIVVLADKIRSLGAHKGILISTSGFQSGAAEYAKQHGIALIQIFDKFVMHIQAQASSDPQVDSVIREFNERSPEFYAYQWNTHLTDFPDKKIYPSESMLSKIRKEITKRLSKSNEQKNF
ncbi:restriction endonuclease [Paenibacillus favisporus]|uniref:restriction endonuclease n=1 Tax=Paenibacillus favisporus TaxID=221028 RepID=UPI002DB91AE0|nr:restriction endonuclease [Paenibacillus favisporus]MEC0178443.1 restriction endonuclease [Paenibacillus favisporus]